MKRASSVILVFMFFANATAVVLDSSASGWSDAADQDVSLGATQAIADLQADLRTIQTSGGFAETLFATLSSVGNTIEAILKGTYAAPEMLVNAGLPAWMTAFLFAPLIVVVGLDFVYFITGREL